jgi:peptidoglycan/LPS O-acetylase OafA/YrhL
MEGHVQGLRGVAITLVMLYHLSIPGFPGGYLGVDVFFVISGYVISRSLLAEWRSTGTIRLWGFFARRARRILPVSTVVIAITLAAIGRMFGRPILATFSGQAKAATLGYLNLWSARHAVSYGAPDALASPFGHMWSLAVEEQFYLFAAPAALLGLRLLGKARRTALAIVLVGIAASYAIGQVYARSSQPALAFYLPDARAWELLVGVLLTGLALRPLRSWAPVVGWIGLGAIVVGCHHFATTGGRPTPGPLVAVVGAALVILAGAGTGSARWSVTVALSVWPLRAIGAIAYPLYLWHWVVLSLLFLRDPTFGHARLVAIVTSVVLAWLTHVLIEDRVRWVPVLVKRPRATVALAVVGSIALFLGVGAITAPRPIGVRPASAHATTHYLPTNLRPSLQFTLDHGQPTMPPCSFDPAGEYEGCVLGDPHGTKTVLAVGDSHLASLLWPLDIAGMARGWRVVFRYEPGCSWIRLTGGDADPGRSCGRALDEQARLSRQVRPDLVVATAFDASELGNTDQHRLDADVARTLGRYAHAGRFVVLADIPIPPANWQQCLIDNQHDTRRCAFDRKRGLDLRTRSLVRTAAARAGATNRDLVPLVCPTSRCTIVRGNVLLYRDGDHLSSEFAVTLAPALEALLAPLVSRS